MFVQSSSRVRNVKVLCGFDAVGRLLSLAGMVRRRISMVEYSQRCKRVGVSVCCRSSGSCLGL